jgi:23S rRNA (cytosine1962-C5)-methyltransferase
MKNSEVDFLELLQKAQSLRSAVAKKSTAYRVVNGAPEGFPGVTLDCYGSHYQLQFFGSDLLSCREKLVAAIREAFDPKFLVSKFRLDPDGHSLETPLMEVEIGDAADAAATVREGDCLFNVNLLDTVNPGLFLDMRAVREDVEKRSRGRQILNLFSYTCSFGVHARKGGAERAVNVDISGKVLDKGRENYELNGIGAKPGEFFRGSALEYLAWCVRKGHRFGGIVLDPPSFARYKGTTFRVHEDLQMLVGIAASILDSDGFFMVSTNYSGYTPRHLADETLETLEKVFPAVRLAWAHGQDADFPGTGKMKESCLSAAMFLT